MMESRRITATRRRLYQAAAAGMSALLLSGLGAVRPSIAGAATATSTSAPTPLAPQVLAASSGKSIRVQWRNAPNNARTFTVSRSDGTTTVNLTPTPTPAHSFLDKTAQPNVSYTYSVTVASVGASQPGKAALP